MLIAILYLLLTILQIDSHSLSGFRFGASYSRINNSRSQNGTSSTILKDKNKAVIQTNDLIDALQSSLSLFNKSTNELAALGWRLVQQKDFFSLYKRLAKQKGNGPYEYMMMGEFANVTPRDFLFYQTQEHLRRLWDETLKSMSTLSQQLISSSSGLDSQDIIYYRTKWPWPLKDRDYTLTRR